MNAVSLFAGIGGIDLALHRAGIPVAAAVEIDNAARGVLKHRFPETTLYTDVCEVTGNDLLAAGFTPRDGVLVGGFPCQDLSTAGHRAGLEGVRSGLFWEIIRLVKAVEPRWIVLENVPGLLSSAGGRDMGTVLTALGKCGYGFAYRVLDAQHFGVPQRRRRVVIVGCLGDNGSAAGEVLALTPSRTGDSQSNGTERLETSRTPEVASGEPGWWVKSKRQTSIYDHETWKTGGVAPTLNVNDVGDSRAVVLVEQPMAFSHTARATMQPSTAITPSLKVLSNVAVAQGSTLRRVTPLECERLQGFPDHWTAERYDFKKNIIIEQADSPRYKQLGNAVAVPVFEWVAKRLVQVEESRNVGR